MLLYSVEYNKIFVFNTSSTLSINCTNLIWWLVCSAVMLSTIKKGKNDEVHWRLKLGLTLDNNHNNWIIHYSIIPSNSSFRILGKFISTTVVVITSTITLVFSYLKAKFIIKLNITNIYTLWTAINIIDMYISFNVRICKPINTYFLGVGKTINMLFKLYLRQSTKIIS